MTRFDIATGCSHCVSRRSLVLGGGAAAAAALVPGGARAQSPFRIDVHHHPYFQSYAVEAARKYPPMPAFLKTWTLQKSLEDMDKADIQASMMSMALPGIWFGDAGDAAKLARLCNEEMAKVVADRPTRFGAFAALPMPDIDGSLAEVAYALDTLKADGIGLFTSYGNKWLGDPAFAPLLEELNRRKALVYVHATVAPCCGNLIPGVPDSVVEYGADTARAIAGLTLTGATTRWPDIRFIFSHAGGAMPGLIERFDVAAGFPAIAKNLPGGIRQALKAFYYDTAQSANPAALGALAAVADPGRILFGSDFPFRGSAEQTKTLAASGLAAGQVAAIERGNALALLPRLKG